MRPLVLIPGLVLALVFSLLAIPLQASTAPAPASCWGQASAVFAQLGEMGEHAAGFDTPRLGLRNLARQLYEAGVIADDTMQALGAFVAEAEGLTIGACLQVERAD